MWSRQKLPRLQASSRSHKLISKSQVIFCSQRIKRKTISNQHSSFKTNNFNFASMQRRDILLEACAYLRENYKEINRENYKGLEKSTAHVDFRQFNFQSRSPRQCFQRLLILLRMSQYLQQKMLERQYRKVIKRMRIKIKTIDEYTTITIHFNQHVQGFYQWQLRLLYEHYIGDKSYWIDLLKDSQQLIMSVYIEQGSKFGQSSKKTSVFQSTINRNSMMNHERDLRLMGSIDEQVINFYYRRGITYTLMNRDLKLKNQSHTHIIRFKIQSNNPSHYTVHPSTAEILPNKTIEIVIQINGLDQISEIGPSFFAKFVSDKFKISWFSYRQTERHFMSNKTASKFAQFKMVFKVRINIDQQHHDQEEDRKKPLELGEKVSQSLEDNKRELIRLQNLISEKEVEKIDESCVNFNLIVVMSIIAFLIGLIFPFN